MQSKTFTQIMYGVAVHLDTALLIVWLVNPISHLVIRTALTNYRTPRISTEYLYIRSSNKYYSNM